MRGARSTGRWRANTGGGSGTQARRAATFTNMIGFNTHIGGTSSTVLYTPGNGAQIVTAMAYVGANKIRDNLTGGTLPFDFDTIANAGIKFNLVCSATGPGSVVNVSGDVSTLLAFQAAHPGGILSFEGPNEYNVTGQIYNSVTADQTNQNTWGQDVSAAYHAAIRAQSSLNNISLVSPSLVQGSGPEPVYGSSIDATNKHIYPENGTQVGQPPGSLTPWLNQAAIEGPGLPIWVTETGAANCAFSGGSYACQGSEQAQGITGINMLLLCFSLGIKQVFIYELSMENNSSNVQENSMGWFHTDASPTLGATYLHNISTLLQDTVSNALTFPLGSIPYSLSGAPSGTLSILLERSDASFWIVLWNPAATIVNGSTAAFSPPGAVSVTVNFGQTVSAFAVFDPTVGTSAIASGSSASSTVVSFSASPIFVKVQR